MSDKYILDNHLPVKEPDLLKWAEWFETADRRVEKTTLPSGVEVSTVFLGLDHCFDGGEPLLFETMIFCGPYDQYQTRCSTWEQAVKMHQNALSLAKGGSGED